MHTALFYHLSGVLQRKGYQVEWKPHISTAKGLRKPDLMATMWMLALVIDVHIFVGKVDMMVVRETKIRKYSDNPDIDAAIKLKPGVTEVKHCLLIKSTAKGFGATGSRRTSSDFIALAAVTDRHPFYVR